MKKLGLPDLKRFGIIWSKYEFTPQEISHLMMLPAIVQSLLNLLDDIHIKSTIVQGQLAILDDGSLSQTFEKLWDLAHKKQGQGLHVALELFKHWSGRASELLPKTDPIIAKYNKIQREYASVQRTGIDNPLLACVLDVRRDAARPGGGTTPQRPDGRPRG